MSTTRTVTDAQGAKWSVRDIADGVEDWTLVRGSATPEFRAGANYALVDRPSPVRASRAASRSRSSVASSTSRRVGLVVLSAAARGQIIDQVLNFEDGPHPARESGGWLVGRFEPGALIITAAYGAGPDSEHRYGSMRLPLAYTRSVVNDLRADERIVGDWHSHSDASDPSTADRRAWAGLSERAGAPWCGLLVARNGADWAYPVFASYLVRGDEQSIQQPALEVQRWRQ
jgi:proteasome lid subunit RPN8/RPN11